MASTSIHIGAADTLNQTNEKKGGTQVKTSKTLMQRINDYLAKFTPIKVGEKASFFRLLATMINAGLSIIKSLAILVEQVENVHLKKILRQVMEDIEAGGTFSGSLAKFPDQFDQAQVGMVEAGEASGQLNKVLVQMAKEAEKSAALLHKLKTAMIYPAVVILIMIASGTLVMIFVMPQLKEVFESLGGELPAVTQFLITFSDFLIGSTFGLQNIIWIFMGLVLLVGSILWWKKTKTGGVIWAKFIFAVPVFGKLVKKVSIARFCRSLNTLIGSGLPILKALRITSVSIGNPLYAKRISEISDDVRHGIPMGENMKNDKKFFPSMVVGMITVAEQTAKLTEITGHLADYYEGEVDDTVKGLSSLIEPIIIVLLGSAIAVLVFAVMQPILTASDLVG